MASLERFRTQICAPRGSEGKNKKAGEVVPDHLAPPVLGMVGKGKPWGNQHIRMSSVLNPAAEEKYQIPSAELPRIEKWD